MTVTHRQFELYRIDTLLQEDRQPQLLLVFVILFVSINVYMDVISDVVFLTIKLVTTYQDP